MVSIMRRTSMAPQPTDDRRALIAAVFVLAVIAGIGAVTERVSSTGQESGRARTGRLAVRTIPEAATVFVDGETRGLSPLTVSNLSVGDHELMVRKAGFLDNRSTVQIRADAVTSVTINLTGNTATGEPVVKPPDTGGGSPLKWVLLGGAGAAVAGVLAAKPKDSGGGGGGATTTTVGSSTTTTVSGGSSTTTSVGATRFTLTGRVTDGNGGAAIQGAEPTILDGPNAGAYPGTSSNGNYSIPNLPAGSFRIEFRALNYDLSPAQTVTITNSDAVHNRTMSISVPRADFSQGTCTANGTATTTGLNCTVDGGPSQGRIDSYTWSYEGGGGSDQRHSMQMPCGGRPIGNNSVPVTLTVRNRSGSDTLTKNVTVNKIQGCW